MLKSFELQLVRNIYLNDGKSEFKKQEVLLTEKLFVFCPTEDVTFDLDLSRCRRERDEGDSLAPSCYGKSLRVDYRLRLAEVRFAAMCFGSEAAPSLVDPYTLETPLRVLGEPPKPVVDALAASQHRTQTEVEEYFRPEVLDHCVLPQFEYGVVTPAAGATWVTGAEVPVKPHPAENPHYSAQGKANAQYSAGSPPGAQYKAVPTPGRGGGQPVMEGRTMKEPLLQAPASAPPMDQL